MNNIACIEVERYIFWYDSDVFDESGPRLFDVSWLARQGFVTGNSPGRGNAYFLRDQDRGLVLRHYLRGGLPGKFCSDAFLGRIAARSSAMWEFAILADLRCGGLPVPRPCDARFSPSGVVYKADLVTEMLPDARALAEMMAVRPLSDGIWPRSVRRSSNCAALTCIMQT